MSDFNLLTQQQATTCIALLGGITATYHYDVDVPTTVIIERNVDVVNDTGLTYVKRTVVSLLKSDIGRAEIGATISIVDETLTIAGIVSSDDGIVQVYVK